MLDDEQIIVPKYYAQLLEASAKLQFSMPSDLKTGSLLRTLVASKPSGHFLDIGTGTGLSLAWIAEGADESSRIISIDINADFQQVAIDTFSDDLRISIDTADGNEWLTFYDGEQFDLIFADAMPGKFEVLDQTLELIKVGGFYLIDDLLPQPNWPEGHSSRVDALVETLKQRSDFVQTTFNWSTGLMLFTKIK
ncbi:methyltransferase domain-containing protein [Pedobacter sp. MC2016-15]|uniref:O-methyltransferase n=1 Tax=Pedobacter sp. MC2016-15 TaxID=2994473 RepID=UPI00224795FE|nr:methyltransferase domain-containing protein [Pedobacter sp. MC2016-15]MCX2478160.1 methyltransferase domain-containing protein [Pedobacter sp. MC2016-15]